MSFDGLAADNPTHGGIAPQMVGVVHIIVSSACIGGHHARACRVAGSANPANFTGHPPARTEAAYELTFNLGHSVGVDQHVTMRLSHHERGVGRVLFDFLPQSINMSLQSVSVDAWFITPYLP